MEITRSNRAILELLQGGVFKGTITTYTNSTTFTSTDLIGFGDGAFIGWSVFVFRDGAGAGAAPQQQDNVPITGYTSATGVFTHTAFGSGTLATNDEILILHPAIAAIGVRTSGATTGAPGTVYPLIALVKQIINCVYRLGETACADITDPVDMTTEVADNTILANVLTDDGDTSVYDRRIHSLEALYNGTTIRTISAGTKTIASAGTKYLSFDSTTYGAEIISIVVKGIIGAAWTLDVYVPTDDAVASPAAADKRDTIAYLSTDTEGGLLQGFGIIYNGFLNFTNNGGGNQTISDVVIVFRSRANLSVAWEA